MRPLLLAVGLGGLWGCGGASNPPALDAGEVPHAVFVAHEGSFVSYDLNSGKERPGAIADAGPLTGLQALEDGTVLGNLTSGNQVLAVEAKAMTELARRPSSLDGGQRPVRSYLSPVRSGRQYWVALHDGAGAGTAAFLELQRDAGFLEVRGEVRLGGGHHEASFSATRERAVISSQADCALVLGVYDYANVAAVTAVKTWSAADLGWDGTTFPKRCDLTFVTGVPPAPNGCVTSKLSKKAYCSLSGSGAVAVVDLDADPPGLTLLPTAGSGGGTMAASKDGRYVYLGQASPRDGDVGAAVCQVGQLVTLDAMAGTVAQQLPLLYRGTGCTTAVFGTDEATAFPGHLVLGKDGKQLFVTLAVAAGALNARSRQELVVDLSTPGTPLQKVSIVLGEGSSRSDALTGDGRYLLVTNDISNTVTQIDTVALNVVKHLAVKTRPNAVATFGSIAGPSAPTGPVE